MAYPNVAIDSNFYMILSNVPGVEKQSTLKYFDSYVRGVSLPGYSVNVYATDFKGYDELHPMDRKNTDLGEITITFKLSEDYLNYFILMNWMQSLRYGRNLVDDGQYEHPRLKMNVINEMDVFILDNQKAKIAKIRFTKCLPTDLGSLDLTYGSDEELEFSLSLRYEAITIEVPDAVESVNLCIPSSSASSSASSGTTGGL